MAGLPSSSPEDDGSAPHGAPIVVGGRGCSYLTTPSFEDSILADPQTPIDIDVPPEGARPASNRSLLRTASPMPGRAPRDRAYSLSVLFRAWWIIDAPSAIIPVPEGIALVSEPNSPVEPIPV
jgi:hypothetical protein